MVNFRTLDLNLLRVFDALMQTRNVTRAADRLGLTQPAVSAALARLRDHLGDPLFVRVGNGMVPSPRAEALSRPIAAALDRLAQALDQTDGFDPATAQASFTLRGADFFSMRLLPALAARISSEAPGVTLRYLDSGRGELLAMLEQGEIDLALEQPMQTPAWVSRALLFPSPFVVVAARANPAIAGLDPGQDLPLDLFCALPHALRSADGSGSGMTDAALARHDRARRVALIVPHFEAVMHAVAQSHMISVVPVQLAQDIAAQLDLVVFRPPIQIPVPDLQLYWHSRLDNAPAHQWLRQTVLREVARKWGGDPGFD